MEQYVEVECPEDLEVVRKVCNQVMKSASFGFLQVNIHVPNDLEEGFSEFCPLFSLWIPFWKKNPQAHERVPEKNWVKDDSRNWKALGHHEREKAFAVYTSVAVVLQPQPKSNRHS